MKKKLQIFGVAFAALLVFGALTAMAASAVEFLLAEWLVGGKALTAELAVETTGELLLADTNVFGTEAKVLCSGIFVGTVGPGSADLITEILSLAKTAPPISCTVQKDCEASTTPKVTPINLPWVTEAELMVDGTETFMVDLTKAANGAAFGWKLTECLVLGISTPDECTTTEGVNELHLEGTKLLGTFSTAFTTLAGLKLAKCTVGGEEKGVVEGTGELVPDTTEELTTSSETTVA